MKQCQRDDRFCKNHKYCKFKTCSSSSSSSRSSSSSSSKCLVLFSNFESAVVKWNRIITYVFMNIRACFLCDANA